jgi:DNA repair exonuclease SbcCD ATPase subunit
METTTTIPAAVELRTEQERLERLRHVLVAIAEVRAARGRSEGRNIPGNVLSGIRVDYDGSVYNLPGVPSTEAAAAQLVKVEERLAEIADLLPQAEEREAADQAVAQQAAERDRRRQRFARLDECREAAEVAAAAAAETARARAALSTALVGSPLDALLRSQQALLQAAQRFGAALSRAREDREFVLNELGEDATAARRALSLLPGVYSPSALRPEPQHVEHGWFISAITGLPELYEAVRALNEQVAHLQSGGR